MSKISFLVEGMNNDKEINFKSFPEIYSIMQLAEINKINTFDAIESYSPEVFCHIFQQVKIEYVITHVIVSFAAEGDVTDIIDKIIAPTIRYAKSKGLDLPLWATELNLTIATEIMSNTLSIDFNNDYNAFKNELKIVHEKFSEISDKLSIAKFLRYLEQNPEVEEVYGLIGSGHLPFIDSLSVNKVTTDSSSKAELVVNGRSVKVFLFGGTHGDTEHSNELSTTLFKNHPELERDPLALLGYKFLTDNFNTEDLIAILSTILPNKSQFDSKSEVENNIDSNLNQICYKDLSKTPIKCAERFDYWINNYNHSDRNETTDTDKMVQWLSYDLGAKCIKDYKDFEEMAHILKTMGYDTSVTP